MTPVVSIIVPVYNAEKTIGRCIESILSQTFRDFELILLDDGSTDSSGAVCDGFAVEDDRIRVIHKENSGVSDTRNLGITLARGEYLQFLDSDDWITPDATGLFMRSAVENQADMVIADFYRVIGERVSQKGAIEDDGLLDRAAFAACMMKNPADFYYGVLWNKLFKRSIIEEHQLKMDASISWCEDFMFNLEYIRHVKSIYVLKVPVYYYVKTKGSLVSQGNSVKKTIQMKRMVFTYYNDFYKDIFSEEEYEKRRMQIYRFLIDAATDGTIPLPILPGSFRLGDERTNVSEGVETGEGFNFEIYREQKLWEKLLDAVALKNELSVADIRLLYFLNQPHEKCTMKEMAGILNISRYQMSKSLQKLLSKELIEVKDKAKKREYIVTEEAEYVLEERRTVVEDYKKLLYEGFSKEEIELYEKLDKMKNENIRRALVQMNQNITVEEEQAKARH